MFKLSCFHYHPHSHKPKKTIQPSVAVTMQAHEYRIGSTVSPPVMEPHEDSGFSGKAKIEKSTSLIERFHSDEMETNHTTVNELKSQQSGLKKSKSLGCVMLEERQSSGSNNESETEQTHVSNELTGRGDYKDEVASYSNQDPDFPRDSVQVSSNRAIDESMFSVGGSELPEKEIQASDAALLSDECAKEDHSDHTTRAIPVMVKSRSCPNMSGYAHPPKPSRSRSSLDLHVLDMRRKENSFHEAVEEQLSRDEERDDNLAKNDTNVYEYTAEGYVSYDYVGAKDWIMPVVDEAETDKNVVGETSSHQWEEVPRKDFKTKRIEEWVMDLQHCLPLEEEEPVPNSSEPVKKATDVTDGLTAIKMNATVTPGMEAAKKYISALSPASTAAHLENHGLVVIPFLSAFVGLKVLNLSGNAIVRITAGALPRGLHVLNLSKNHISTIEGLRELTRLRVLDLSYNRIFRIGHGLASCASLKELYLAGNKISEVEGLHRLLKLHVLDLRFNKLSTTKCLGQLAANYNSLQAISLEGNPAQKNVGDDQLKKYLLGLLPHLAYYNRHPIKSSSLKDAADRSLRLGISDRSMRSDPKLARKTTAHKTVTSSSHGRKTQAAPSQKVSRGRHGRQLPPPSGTKALASQKPSYFDIGNKLLLSLRSDLSMRKSRSEGNLGGL